MIRPIGILCLTVLIVSPVTAGELPEIVNLSPALPTIINGKANAEAPAADPPPKIINLPSGSDGTQPAPAPAVRPAVATVVSPVYSIYSSEMLTSYASATSNYYASSFGAGYYDVGWFPAAYYGWPSYGWPNNFWVPHTSAYFYSYGAPVVLYRDIVSRPLGRGFYLPIGGLAVPNSMGYVGYAGGRAWR